MQAVSRANRLNSLVSRMRKITLLYALLVFFYSLVMLLFILAGSHGKLILNNVETLQYLAVVVTFIIMAIVTLSIKKASINRSLKAPIIIFNIVTKMVICYQIYLLLSEKYTFLSTFVFSLQLLGLFLGILITYTLITDHR